MIQHIQLQADTTLLERTKSGNVFGPVHIQIEEDYFPARGWTDFVEAFVRAWMEALIEIATDSTESEQVFFMDGPYTIEILRLDRSLVELRFSKGRRAEDVLLFSVEGEIKALLADAVGVSENLLSECRRREWSTNDTSPLLEATEIGAELCSRLGE